MPRGNRHPRPQESVNGHQRRLLSFKQAHEEFGPSEDQFARWVALGDLPIVRPPHCRRKYLDRSDVERLLFERWKERA
jgi:hypothetical protein